MSKTTVQPSTLKFQFSGKVFCKENREGIENLIVSIFDYDAASSQQFLREVSGEISPGLFTQNSVSFDRLGSVITQGDGGFNVIFDHFEFAHDEKDGDNQKPDLLIMVQAPAEPNERLTGFGKILYYSMLPTPITRYGIDVARSEALVIAIPRDTLAQHGIPVSGFSRAPINSKKKQRELNELFTSRGLSGFSSEQRSSPYYFSAGSDSISRLLTERDKLELISLNREAGDASSRRSGLQLKPGILSELNIIDPTNLANILPAIRRKIGFGDLTRTDNIVQKCKSRLQQRTSLGALEADETETALDIARRQEEQVLPGQSSPEQNPDSLFSVANDLQGELQDWVRAHLGSAGTPESALEYGTYEKGQNPDAALNLRLKSGPADVTAYHDFDHLQIAFKHIWTEAFNEGYQDIVEREFEEEIETDVTIQSDLEVPYKTTVYAEGSINFGLLFTYRQTWDSLDYQAGQLLKTITLTPGEKREYTLETSFEKTNTEKHIEENQQTRKKELNSSLSSIRDAVERAKKTNSFEANASGGVRVGVFNGSASTSVGVDSSKESEANKKSVRERTKNALQEQINKTNKEINITSSLSSTQGEKRTVENKNDEMAVTYLFYELQRRFRVKEKLHRLRPVIFVANKVPRPIEITSRWVSSQAWIIRRVLLDREFLEPLELTTEGVDAEEKAQRYWQDVIDNLKQEIDSINTEITKLEDISREAFDTIKKIADGSFAGGDSTTRGDIIKGLAFGPFGGFGRRRRRKAKAKRIKAIEENLELQREEAEGDIDELEARLAEEESALEAAIRAKNEVDITFYRKNAQINRLIVHIHQNIIYYMQAIWDHEPPDQRFFRLQNLEVNWLKDPEAGEAGISENNDTVLPTPDESLFQNPKPRLAEVAHIDQLIGFFGNYMIFPVREPNYLHLFMMQEYIDLEVGGARDPDEFSNLTLEDIIEYLACVREQSDSRYRQELERLTPILEERMRSGRTHDEVMVVPTDSVFVQAMPDRANPVLEDFKLAHRALDVKKVQAEVREMEIENIRRGARIIGNDLSDPDDDPFDDRS